MRAVLWAVRVVATTRPNPQVDFEEFVAMMKKKMAGSSVEEMFESFKVRACAV
jgi:Ca2+-binding EF-hand superfamily protein